MGYRTMLAVATATNKGDRSIFFTRTRPPQKEWIDLFSFSGGVYRLTQLARRTNRSVPFVFLLFMATLVRADDVVVADWANELARAYRNSDAIPVLSYRYTSVDALQAYRIQAAYVDFRNTRDRVVGYKAATTSRAAQRALGIRTPTAGVMFGSGAVLSGDTIKLADYGRLMVELEIGFRLNRPVSETVIRPHELRKLVAEIVPVIELPDAGYSDRSRSNAMDFIAANALSSGYVAGEPLSPLTTDPNTLLATLMRDDQVINEATGDDALGDQWAALLWLVNHTVAQGYTITPNDLLITGLLGRPIVAETGEYIALYDDHEPLRLRIR